MKKHFFLIVAFFFLFTSCKKEEITETVVELKTADLTFNPTTGELKLVATFEGEPDHVVAMVKSDSGYTYTLDLTKQNHYTSQIYFLEGDVPNGTVFKAELYYQDEILGYSNEATVDFGTGSGTDSTIILGPAEHTPTTNGGTSVIHISGNGDADYLANVIATRVSDGLVLGTYAINIPAGADTFTVVVDYTAQPIYNTEINLRVEVDGVVENFQYTTLEEQTCVLSLTGSYTDGDSEVSITISGNDRPATFEFVASDNNGTVLNVYTGTMNATESSKTFTFPIEEVNNTLIHYVVTSPQHPLCVLDNFSYTTPDRQTSIVVTGVMPGTLTPSGGQISGTYTNTNFPSGEVATLTVTTASTGMYFVDTNGNFVTSIEIELPGVSGNFSYTFKSFRDENPGSFNHSSPYMSGDVMMNVVTLTQTYDLAGNMDATEVLPNQTTNTVLASFDLSANYPGTHAEEISLKIKTPGVNPWEIYTVLVVNGVVFPVTDPSDWGSVDNDGFYTFTINSDAPIDTNNTDFIVVEYRSGNFTAGAGGTTEMKVSVETDLIDNSTGSQFQPESSILSVGIQ